MIPVAARIKNEIELHGAIPFARFMELSLYSPGEGYYETHQQIGRAGDFITSVSVGNLFGEILAFQFAEWLEEHRTRNVECGNPNLQIVEAGAHDGQLALDMLNWMKKFRPQIFEELDYCILEPSPMCRNRQQTALAEFSDKTSWFGGWSDFPHSAFRIPRFTIVFSNELFDAMPVHRFGWDKKIKSWFEWAVGWSGNKFTWERASEKQRSSVPFPQVNPALLEVLPDEFTTEICPAAVGWWATAAKFLHRGKMVAIDYGLVAEQFFVPERSNGTLRSISRHHASTDLLLMPGEQDITAHVNFSALKMAGEEVGLKTDTLESQSQFLTGIVERNLNNSGIFAEWDPARRRQFQTLTHPEHFGRAFQVLVQSR